MELEQAQAEVDRLTVIANKLSLLVDKKNNIIESLRQEVAQGHTRHDALRQEVTTLWYEIDHLNGDLK